MGPRPSGKNSRWSLINTNCPRGAIPHGGTRRRQDRLNQESDAPIVSHFAGILISEAITPGDKTGAASHRRKLLALFSRRPQPL